MESLFYGKIWLAPLAGYTDSPFRRICKKWGADVLVSEMVSADGLTRDSLKTYAYLRFRPIERPFGIQLFGSDPTIMARAAEYVLEHEPNFIDVNMGCPARKIINRGAGGSLMRNHALAASIVSEMKRSIGGRCPLTVKFRSGWDSASLNYYDFALYMQDAGADAVCLHPRTVKQAFSGTSNWQHIYEVKCALSIPVIGNGDITTVELVHRMMQETLCDSIMIGRCAVGKPWIFTQIKHSMHGQQSEDITAQDQLQTILEHIDHALEDKPPSKVAQEMRAHLCHYTKGLTGGAALRDKLNHSHSIEEMKALLHDFFV